MIWLLTLLSASAEPLGQGPLCEASGASLLSEERVVVVDNEHEAGLFLFDISDAGLIHQREIAFRGEPEVRDIEAVVYSSGFMGVVGSHSHKRYRENETPQCPQSKRRNTLGIFPFHDDSIGDVRWIKTPKSSSLGSIEGCLKGFFDDQDVLNAQVLCAALVTTESEANKGATECQSTLNIEGAVIVDDRLWLGLRSPTVSGQAVLVRVKGVWPHQIIEMVWDKVLMLQVPDDSGIRALTLSGENLYGIGGPVQDSANPFVLWRMPAASLDSGLPPAGLEVVGQVPSSSEGLIVSRDRIFGVVDGAEDKESQEACLSPSLQWRIGQKP